MTGLKWQGRLDTHIYIDTRRPSGRTHVCLEDFDLISGIFPLAYVTRNMFVSITRTREIRKAVKKKKWKKATHEKKEKKATLNSQNWILSTTSSNGNSTIGDTHFLPSQRSHIEARDLAKWNWFKKEDIARETIRNGFSISLKWIQPLFFLLQDNCQCNWPFLCDFLSKSIDCAIWLCVCVCVCVLSVKTLYSLGPK